MVHDLQENNGNNYTSIQNNSNFKSVTEYQEKFDIAELIRNTTKHLSKNRLERARYALKLNQSSPVHKAFEVDKGHKNGTELHFVTMNGIILIFNKTTKLLITILIARPEQILRLYDAIGATPFKTTLKNAKEHKRKGLNFK